MIKATELQIGDFVLVDGTPRKVEAITKKKIGYHLRENELRLYYERLHDVEPIKITEDLLCKIGFCKEPKNEKIFSCADSVDEVYAWDAGYIMGTPPKIRISSSDTLVASASCYVSAKYLHELQHAFKLCGVNFEVKV